MKKINILNWSSLNINDRPQTLSLTWQLFNFIYNSLNMQLHDNLI